MAWAESSSSRPHGCQTARRADFERVVARLKLTPADYATSPQLRTWVEKNCRQKFVPEKLLKLWVLDWGSAVRRELKTLHNSDPQATAALARILPAYLGALNDPSSLAELQQMITKAPKPLPNTIPLPRRVLEEKQDLGDWLVKTRTLLE